MNLASSQTQAGHEELTEAVLGMLSRPLFFFPFVLNLWVNYFEMSVLHSFVTQAKKETKHKHAHAHNHANFQPHREAATSSSARNIWQLQERKRLREKDVN